MRQRKPLTKIRMALCLWLVCVLVLPVPLASAADQWKIVDFSQSANKLTLVFTHSEAPIDNPASIRYMVGEAALDVDESAKGNVSVAYTFVLDNTMNAGLAVTLGDILSYATSRMTDSDLVRIISANSDKETGYGAPSQWRSLLQQADLLENQSQPAQNSQGNNNYVYIYERIMSAIQKINNEKYARYVIIVVTDGGKLQGSVTQENIRDSLIRLGGKASIHFLITNTSYYDNGKELAEFGNTLTANGSGIADQSTYKSYLDNATSVSGTYYRAVLRLTQEARAERDAQGTNLPITLIYKGSAVASASYVIDYQNVPTYTPEPEVTPYVTPTPTPDPAEVATYHTEDDPDLLRSINDHLVELYYLDERDHPGSAYTRATDVAAQKFYTLNGLTGKPANGMDAAGVDVLLYGDPIPNPTATPAPTVTPDPNAEYVSAGIGDNERISKLQNALKRLYYYDGAVDGVYSPALTTAIDDFLTDHPELSRTSTGLGLTQAAYTYILSGEPAARATATPEPSPTPDPNPPYLAPDSDNFERISELQGALRRLYYYDGAVDGQYGPALALAVSDFLRDNRDVARTSSGNGITEAAFLLITGEDAKPRATSTPEPTETPDPNPAYFDENSSALEIGRVAERLVELYYLSEEEGRTTVYTNALDKALIRFRQDNGLPTPSGGTGLTRVGYDWLISDNPRPLPTETPDPNLLFAYDSNLTQNPDALQLRDRLIALGYLPQTQELTADALRMAIHDFAQRNPAAQELSQGVSLSAYQAVMEEDARPKQDEKVALYPGMVPQNEVQSQQIRDVQERLHALDYDRDLGEPYVAGRYDETTRQAWHLFAQVNELSRDNDVISLEDQELLLSDRARENPPVALQEAVQTWMTGDVASVGQLRVQNWVLVAAAVVALIAVIVIAVIIHGRGKHASSGETSSRKNSANRVSGPKNSNNSDDVTRDSDQSDEVTMEEPSGVWTPGGGASTVVQMAITYNGSTRHVSARADHPITIGRLDCEVSIDQSDKRAGRKHCELTLSGGLMYVRVLTRGRTLINGQPIGGAQDAAPSFDLSDMATQEEDGAVLHSGDVLTCGYHDIQVTY